MRTNRILFPSVLLLTLLIGRTAFGATTEQVRADLDTILSENQRIDAVMGKSAAESLAEARRVVAALSTEELETLTPYAASIANLEEQTVAFADRVVSTARAARAAQRARSAGFPDAEYYTDDMCTGIRTDTAAMKVAWNIYWTAETVMLAAEFGCEQDILGTNTAPVCIPLAVAVGVAQQVIENYQFCDDDVDSAEIQGSYLRLGHLHDDMTVVQETLDQGTIEQIQMDLARRRFHVAEFILPSAFGGKLEQARTVVMDVLARMIAENIDVRRAVDHVALSDAFYDAADWKGAYRQLGFAYREAVKLH